MAASAGLKLSALRVRLFWCKESRQGNIAALSGRNLMKSGCGQNQTKRLLTGIVIGVDNSTSKSIQGRISMRHIYSHNYDAFACTAGACPASCCKGGWQIMIDDEHLEQYTQDTGDSSLIMSLS